MQPGRSLHRALADTSSSSCALELTGSQHRAETTALLDYLSNNCMPAAPHVSALHSGMRAVREMQAAVLC